jgi:hypothetical protein
MPVHIAKDDLHRIRPSLALAAALGLAGAAGVFASGQALRAAQKAHGEAETTLEDIQGRLSRAREEEQDLKRKIARFGELAARGLIGQEQRLHWVESMRRIRQARKLFDLQYEIAPQRHLDAAPDAGGFAFMASSMQLSMQLLHEEDLLGFLGELRASVNAHLRIRRCEVERLPRGPEEGSVLEPQLKARCELDWITLREGKDAS